MFQKIFCTVALCASLLCTSHLQAHDPTTQLNLSIDGSLAVNELGQFILEGDLFIRGGRLDGLKIGRYDDVAFPMVDPDCDPVAASAFGFNAATGAAMFSFGNRWFNLGSITTEYSSCVIETNLETFEIAIVSSGLIVGGDGIFEGVSGTLESSATVSMATGAVNVIATLNIPRYH